MRLWLSFTSSLYLSIFKNKNVYYFYNQEISQSHHHLGKEKQKEKLQDEGNDMLMLARAPGRPCLSPLMTGTVWIILLQILMVIMSLAPWFCPILRVRLTSALRHLNTLNYQGKGARDSGEQVSGGETDLPG